MKQLNELQRLKENLISNVNSILTNIQKQKKIYSNVCLPTLTFNTRRIRGNSYNYIKLQTSLRNDENLMSEKTKVKLNLPMKKDAVFEKQRISKVPIHLRERIQKLLDVIKKYDIIAPVNKEQLATGNTFTNPVIILRKGESLEIVLDARYTI